MLCLSSRSIARVPLGLTPRQAEVLYWIAQGKTNAETAIILGTSPRTIDKHVEQLLERLGVENRLAAAAKANDIPTPTSARTTRCR